MLLLMLTQVYSEYVVIEVLNDLNRMYGLVPVLVLLTIFPLCVTVLLELLTIAISIT